MKTRIKNNWITDLACGLFDYTNNKYAKERLDILIDNPLTNRGDILNIQNILKGIIDNKALLINNGYSKIDFNDVYGFLKPIDPVKISFKKRLWLHISVEEKMKLQSKMLQTSQLLLKLYTQYFKTLDVSKFPADYQKEIKWNSDFLASFNLESLEKQIIKTGNLSIKELIEFHASLTKEIENERFTKFWNSLFLFEAYISISKRISISGFVFPEISNDTFAINGLYHPLVNNPVINSITIKNNVSVFTGPNMSGKSTFLKALSICVYFSQLGFAIPAGRSAIPVFEYFFTSINKEDDITKGYSHFMNEIVQLKEVVENANKSIKCFAVFDEIFRGTNYEDAINITTLTLNGLTRFNTSVFFISTHLHNLKDIDCIRKKEAATYFFESVVTDGTPLFSYTLKEGWSSLKLGETLFKLSGLEQLL